MHIWNILNSRNGRMRDREGKLDVNKNHYHLECIILVHVNENHSEWVGIS